MVCLGGLDIKSYVQRIFLEGELPAVTCPDPHCAGQRLGGHGCYFRYLAGHLTPIRRLRCPRCGVTHALLPEDVCAYRDLSLETVEKGLEAAGPTSAARAAGESTDEAGVRRARRWWHRPRVAAWTSHLQALLPPAPGRWWERAVALLGPAPGWLVRLRHWLASKWRCFFGGLTGLYRHGRPGLDFRGNSTEVGLWFSEGKP